MSSGPLVRWSTELVPASGPGRAATLFGSHARGEGTAGSDVDAFLLVEDLEERERGELFDLAGEVSIEHLVAMQAFAPLSPEYRWLEQNECRIVGDIAREGVPL